MSLVVSRMHRTSDAGGKARIDVRDILRSIGYSAADMDTSGSRRARAGRSLREAPRVAHALRSLDADDVVVWQFPLGKVGDWVVARSTRSITIALVHDLETMRQEASADPDMALLRNCDAIISHNASMTRWLEKHLGRDIPIVEIEIFDYLTTDAEVQSDCSERPECLYVAGNLSHHKIAWIRDAGTTAVPIAAYGPSFDPTHFADSVDWRGVLDVDDPRLPRRDGFGLVWAGDSPDHLTPPHGSYLRINSPHKVSFYLTLGLPVIVPDDAAVAPFVVSEGVGLTAPTVGAAAELVANVDADRWADLLDRVQVLRSSLQAGRFTLAAVSEAETRVRAMRQ